MEAAGSLQMSFPIDYKELHFHNPLPETLPT
jgi:hypothetical protein